MRLDALPSTWGIEDTTAVEVGRTRHGKKFQTVVGSHGGEHNIYIFEPMIHYESSPGEWEETDLNFRSDGSEFIVDKHIIHTKVSASRVEVVDRDTGKGIRWLTPDPPAVADRHATYVDGGLSWQYSTVRSGLKLEAEVSTPQGPQTYNFVYQMLGGAPDLTLDGQGNAVSDGFKVVQPRIRGSGPNEYRATLPWRLAPGPRIEFDFDDADIPRECYPYTIDPTTNFDVAAGGDDGQVGQCGCQYPPTDSGIVVCTSDTNIEPARTATGCTYRLVRVALARWCTSAICCSDTIDSAKLTLHVSAISNAICLSLTADWYTSWPIDAADYTPCFGSDAITGIALSSFSIGAGNCVALSNVTGISKTGYTGLRFHLNGTDPLPVGDGTNRLGIRSEEHPNQPPIRLVVESTTGFTPQVIIFG